jgi:branched-chain amino acid transport system permease protein
VNDRHKSTAVLFVGLASIVIAAAYLGSLGPNTIDRSVVNALVRLILAIGLSTFVGLSGVFSFGHMAFMAVGAYSTAVLTMSPIQKQLQLPDLPGSLGTWHASPIPAVLVGGVVAAIFALVVAVPLMRLNGLTASLATVALLITMRVVNQNWETFTRGTPGLIVDAPSPSKEAILAWTLVLLLVAIVFRRGSLGRRLAASREDEPSARSLGIRVWWERGVAWVLSAFIVGVGGGLFVLYFGNINPDSFYISITFTVLAMLVVGGLTTISGAVVGVVVVTAVLELLRQVERGLSIGPWTLPTRSGMSELGLAVVLLAMLVVRPDGLVRSELFIARVRAKPARRPAAVDDPPPADPDVAAIDAGFPDDALQKRGVT